MARRRNRWIVLGLSLLACAARLPERAVANDAVTPADVCLKSDAQEGKSRHSVQDIRRKFQQTARETQPFFSSPETLLNEAKRKEAAARAIPALKKMNGLVKELREAPEPLGKGIADGIQPWLVMMLAVFGDKATNAGLEKMARSADKKKP